MAVLSAFSPVTSTPEGPSGSKASINQTTVLRKRSHQVSDYAADEPWASRGCFFLPLVKQKRVDLVPESHKPVLPDQIKRLRSVLDAGFLHRPQDIQAKLGFHMQAPSPA